MIYTGIGSRETPDSILRIMKAYAAKMATDGNLLRSGAAPGADSYFESGCLSVGGSKEIYLPWAGFEGRTGSGYISAIPKEAFEIAATFHPAWERCSQGARKLHTRNVCQILGKDLKTKTDLVVCWTKDGKASGGTGQAIRIAEHYDVRIVNLQRREDLEEVMKYLG